MKDAAVPLCRKFIDANLTDAYELLNEDDIPDSVGEKRQKKVERIEPLPCTDFNKLIQVFEAEGFPLSPNTRLSWAVMIATNISVKLGRPFIWTYLQGPPSSGKSTLCEVISADIHHCEAVDIFTGLHSGHRTKGKKGRDTSLLKLVDGKHWITKDWTATLTQPEPVLERLYGQLRDAYDGTTKTKYGNDVSFSYTDINFAMTAGCTDEILRHSHSHLGERFLLCDLTDDSHGSYKHVRTAFDSFLTSLNNSFPRRETPTDNKEKYIPPDRLLKIKRHAVGFLDHLHDVIQCCDPPEYADEYRLRIIQMSRFIARIRGRVVRDHNKEMLYKPRPEVAIRLSQQLGKLSQCLCIVFGKRAMDHEVLDIVAKVAVDTTRGFNLDIVNHLMHAHNEGKLGLDKGQLATRLDSISSTTVERRLKDMRMLGVVDNVKIPNGAGVQGRHKHLWQVLPKVRRLWNHLIGKKKPALS